MDAARALTVAGVSVVLRCSRRTASRWAAAWADAQSQPVPRVIRLRSGRRGRPAYRVDGPSLHAWLRGDLVAVAANTNATSNDG